MLTNAYKTRAKTVEVVVTLTEVTRAPACQGLRAKIVIKVMQLYLEYECFVNRGPR